MRPTVHVVLPAFNEQESLPSLLERLRELALDTHRVHTWVVDDGSSDRTAEVALAASERMPLTLVQHRRNSGLGAALLTGLRSALDASSDQDTIVVMDADDTHDVELIKQMVLRMRQGADIVIASRYVDGGDDSTAPGYRRLLSRGAASVFRTMFPLDGFNDFTSGYRGYRASLLRRASRHYGERLVEERGFACMVELLLKLRHWGPQIDEVPLVLRYDRKLGGSKLRIARTIAQYIKLAARDRLAEEPNLPALVAAPGRAHEEAA